MHKEIEIKIFEINKQDIEAKLEQIGASKIKDANIESRYFDADPDTAYAKKSVLLRMRDDGTHTKLTYKNLQVIGNIQHNNEIETIVAQPENMKLILEKLGYDQYDHLCKQRSSYALGDMVFDIDTYYDVPTFMEIEGPNAAAVIERIEKLGLTDHPQSGDGYPTIKTMGYNTFITKLKQKQGLA